MQSDTNRKHLNTTESESEECPKCHGQGRYLYISPEGYEFARECDCGCLKREIMERKLRFANIPEAFKDFRMNSFSVSKYRSDNSKELIRKSCKAVAYWLENFDDMRKHGKGLYLYSMTKGSGKTRMAASIANELIHEKRIMVKFATSVQIISEIKATWNRENGISESKLLEQLISADVLVIDDFGTERETNFVSEKFYSIVNGRYVDKKITIFTSNMSLDDLKYDGRITNRIKERNYLIPFPEESVREHIAEDNRKEIGARANG